MKIEFKLHTYDIQYLDIAMIMYRPDTVIKRDDIERIKNKLSELNNLCTKENNYTINVTVES